MNKNRLLLTDFILFYCNTSQHYCFADFLNQIKLNAVCAPTENGDLSLVAIFNALF